MRKARILAVLLAAMLALPACSDTTSVDDVVTTLDDVVTTLGDTAEEVGDDVAATVIEVQAEVTDLATEVQNSAAAAELEQSWNTLQTQVLAALSTIGDDGMVDGSEVQDALDEFQNDVDALGDEVEPTLTEAWDTLRQRLEGMMS